MNIRHRFLAALVVHGRAADEIDGLRRALGSRDLTRIPPHLTLASPVNVRCSLGPVIESLHEVTAPGGSIEIDLGPIGTFAGQSTVYLAASGDLVALSQLHNRLAQGPLRAPEGREHREFVPHVTLTSHVDPARVAGIRDALSAYRITVTFAELTLFEQDLQSLDHRWQAVAEVALGRPAVVGRGGRELTFRDARLLDPVAIEFLRTHWHEHRQTLGHGRELARPFAMSVWFDGRVVGVARGRFIDETLELDRFVVSPSERGTGVGGQLLARLENFARDQGAVQVRLQALAEGEAEGFFVHHGYERVVVLENGRAGRSCAILTHHLALT